MEHRVALGIGDDGRSDARAVAVDVDARHGIEQAEQLGPIDDERVRVNPRRVEAALLANDRTLEIAKRPTGIVFLPRKTSETG